MLDLKYIRQNGDIVTHKLGVKGYDFDFAGFQALDERRKKADIESQNLQAERKSAWKQVGQLISEGLHVDEAKAQIATLLDNIDAKIDGATQAAKQVQQEIEDLLMTIPNLVSDDVPPGDSEADNQEVLQWGVPRQFDFEPKDHVDLGEQLDQMSGDLGVTIAGSRFTVLSHDLARLHRALTQFMLDTHTVEHGYTEVARLLSYASTDDVPSSSASARYALHGPGGDWGVLRQAPSPSRLMRSSRRTDKSDLIFSCPMAWTTSAIRGTTLATAPSRAARPLGLIATNFCRASSQSARMCT